MSNIEIAKTAQRIGFAFEAIANVERGQLICAHPPDFPDNPFMGLGLRTDIRQASLVGISDGAGGMVTTPGQYANFKVYNPFETPLTINAGEPLFMAQLNPQNGIAAQNIRPIYAGVYNFDGYDAIIEEWGGTAFKGWTSWQIGFAAMTVQIPASAPWSPADLDIPLQQLQVNGVYTGAIMFQYFAPPAPPVP
jgi:hypothetical protein